MRSPGAQQPGPSTDSDQNSTGSPPEWRPQLLAQNMLRSDARIEFSTHLFEIYRFWLQLVHNTTLPRNISCTDAGVLAAFQAINRIIASDRHRLARLAYVRLVSLVASLKSTVSMNHKHGRIHRSVGYRNASVVLDIYVMAQATSTDRTRQGLSRRIRAAKRWFHLAGSSPLLLITHSDMAEHIVQVPLCPQRFHHTNQKVRKRELLDHKCGYLTAVCPHIPQGSTRPKFLPPTTNFTIASRLGCTERKEIFKQSGRNF